MKIIAYIFFFYILFLSTVPCCTIDNCTDENNQEEKSSTNQKDDCESCSPFFTCGNCYGVVQIAEPIQLTDIDIQNQIHHERIIFMIPFCYTALHLQPPRIT